MTPQEANIIFVFDELETIAKVLEKAQIEFQKHFPPEMRDHSLKYATHDELDILRAKAKTASPSDKTLNGLMDYLLLCETAVHILERTQDYKDIVRFHPVDGLKPFHAEILKDLGMPDLAQLVKDGLALAPTTEARPKTRAFDGRIVSSNKPYAPQKPKAPSKEKGYDGFIVS